MCWLFFTDYEEIPSVNSSSVRKEFVGMADVTRHTGQHLLVFCFLNINIQAVCLTVLPTNHVRMMTGDMLVCLFSWSFVCRCSSTVSVI